MRRLFHLFMSFSCKFPQPALRECALVSCFHCIIKDIVCAIIKGPVMWFSLGMNFCKTTYPIPCPVMLIQALSMSDTLKMPFTHKLDAIQ